jgi:hypothetical protein
VLHIYYIDGPFCARIYRKLTWFRPHWRVIVTYQSGIESCRGRFTDLNRRLRQKPTRNSNKRLWRRGVGPPDIRLKATYQLLKLTEVAFLLVKEVLILTPRLCRNADRERLWKRGGTSDIRPASSNEPIRMERCMPLFHYLGSLMGSHNSLTGLCHD